MMTGDGQVGDEERPLGRQRVDPLEDARDGRRFVDAEARDLVAADIAGVLQRLVAAVANDRFHAEIHEAARVEERRHVAAARERRRQRRTRRRGVLAGGDVEGGIRRAEHGEEALDALGIHGVRVVEHHRGSRERGKMRHDVWRGAVQAEIARGGRFERGEHHAPSGGRAAKPRQIVARCSIGAGCAPVGRGRRVRGDLRQHRTGERRPCVVVEARRVDARRRRRAERDAREERRDEAARRHTPRAQRRDARQGGGGRHQQDVRRRRVESDRIGNRAARRAPHRERQRRRQHAHDRDVDRGVEREDRVERPCGARPRSEPRVHGGERQHDERVLPEVRDRRPRRRRHRMSPDAGSLRRGEHDDQAERPHARTRLMRFSSATDTIRLSPRLRQIQSWTRTIGAGGRA